MDQPYGVAAALMARLSLKRESRIWRPGIHFTNSYGVLMATQFSLKRPMDLLAREGDLVFP